MQANPFRERRLTALAGVALLAWLGCTGTSKSSAGAQPVSTIGGAGAFASQGS